jgi:hypothetical protein
MLFYNPSEYRVPQYFNFETILTPEEVSELKHMKKFPEKFYPFGALIGAYNEETRSWNLEKIGIIYIRLLGLDPDRDYPKIKNRVLNHKLDLVFEAYIRSMKDPSSPYMSNIGRGRIASELGYDSYKSWATKHKLLKNPFRKKPRRSKTLKKIKGKIKTKTNTRQKHKNHLTRRKKNPTVKDIELYETLRSVREPTGFFVHVYNNRIEITPWIPEWSEWGALYPTLIFPLDQEGKLFRVAKAFGWRPEHGKTREELLKNVKGYLFKFHRRNFRSLERAEALRYLDIYNQLKTIYPEGHRRVY